MLVFILSSLFLILFIFLGLYLIFKTKYAIQDYQQSAYNSTRYVKHIRENFKKIFGLNELLLIAIYVLFYFINRNSDKINLFLLNIQYFLLVLFSYYNLKFFNISKKRYEEKLPLKYTSRVKRLIVTIVILMIIVMYLSILYLNIFLGLIILTFGTYIIVLLAGIINLPIEKVVQGSFKNKAIKKLLTYQDLTVIGITGSYGKTSIKNIIYDIISPEIITLKTPASYNTPMGISLTINNDLTNMYESFLVEMGAYYVGEIKELCDMVHPKVGVVSSIGPQHLETFKNVENVQKTKMELIENLPIDGLGVLNYDNEFIRNYNVKNDVTIKWYSLENKDADLYAYDVRYLSSGMSFKFKYLNEDYEVFTKLLGKHNIYNILAGIIVADFLGISIEKIVENAQKIKPISNRLEYKKVNDEIILIDDAFNGNIEGMLEGLNILRHYEGKRILITPGIIDGGLENEAINERLSENIFGIDNLVIIGEYNKEALRRFVGEEVEVNEFDNFLDGYNFSLNIKGKKTILIANDLPDKYK